MSHEATTPSVAVLPAGSPFPSAGQHISAATPLPPRVPAVRPPADDDTGAVRAAGIVCAAAGPLIALCAASEPVKLTAGAPVFAGDVIISPADGHAMIAFIDGGTLAINGELSTEIVPAGAYQARIAPCGEAAGPEPLLISVKEACRRTDLSRSFMYELMAAGEIPFVHVGTRRLIPFTPFRHWVEQLPGKRGAAR